MNKVDYDIRSFENIFDKMTTSYKIYWFKGIFDEIIRGRKEITFKEIAVRMITYAWYPVLEYHLNYGKQDQMNIYINEIKKLYVKDININRNILYNKLININDKPLLDILESLSRYVPYRLLTPFYTSELRGKSDEVKNEIICELSNKKANSIYKIFSKEEKIIVNDEWYDFISENQNIISGWIKCKLIEFLQIKNPNVPAIINKLEPSKKRNLNIAKKIWNDQTLERLKIYDIYSGIEINSDNISIDHFIPWSFIGHDQLWNLVPTIKNINSSKGDGLPKWDLYFNKFCEMQIICINEVKKMKNKEKLMEDYLSINSEIDIKAICDIKYEINNEIIKRDLKRTLKPIYQLAYNQGFEEWENNIYIKDIQK